jgi:endoglucanase
MKNIFPLKKTKAFLILNLFIIFQISNAQNIINCNSIASVRKAMLEAKPGDDIVIKSGNYKFTDKIIGAFSKDVYLHSKSNGTSSKPITIRGESASNPSVLEGIDYSLSYLLSLEGDYWIIKDLIFKKGSKGIVLDNSNYSKIINVTVSDVGDEAIHLRDGSSYNLIQKCKVFDTGKVQKEYGEGIYVGSDGSQHNDPYIRDCDYNKIQNCILGPNVSAEHIDVKEGTRNTVITECTFFAEGISGANSADSFIDLKGMYGIVFKNTFNTDKAPKLNTMVDFSERVEKTYGGTPEKAKTGYRNAIFDNTINLGSRAGQIATAKKASGDPLETHIWNNKRNPASADYPENDGTEKRVIKSCPPKGWGIINCSNGTLGTEEYNELAFISIFPNPAQDFLNIEGLSSEESFSVSIYNLQGQKIINTTFNTNRSINISEISKGIYVLKINGSNSFSTTKLFQKL